VCGCVGVCVDTRLRLSGCQWAISWPSASQWCATLCEPVRLGWCWAMCSSQSKSSCLCVPLTSTKFQLSCTPSHHSHNTGSGWRGDLCWCRAMCSTAARGGSTQEHCPCSTDVDKYLINSDDLWPLCRQLSLIHSHNTDAATDGQQDLLPSDAKHAWLTSPHRGRLVHITSRHRCFDCRPSTVAGGGVGVV
jgi:hypothetical protein